MVVDLTNNNDFTLKPLVADYIGTTGTALVGNYQSQPAGTGVFQPFLTISSPGSSRVENGYNTDGRTALYLDQQRPAWNNYLRLGDLATFQIGNATYYAFTLDANEPGNSKSLISIDNIRIYTSSTDNTGLVQNNQSNLDLLGTKRFALNDPPSTDPASNDNWIKLDANQPVGNGGSGVADMILYVPVTAFAGALPSDFVWFYNLNGVHFAANTNYGATAGYEEWSAFTRIAPPSSVPDKGGTFLLLAFSLASVAVIRRYTRPIGLR